MQTLAIILAVLFLIVLFAWIGLQIRPAPFAPYSKRTPETFQTVPLPTNLPAPVKRYYRTVYGDQIPVISSMVLTGHGTIQPVSIGPKLPARFLFVHQAGQAYRHYFEATIFGIPFLKVDEGIIEGKSFFESPMGTYHNDPNTNQGANLALWGEAVLFPAIFLTDPRVHWAPVDANTALLYVPYEDRLETFVVRFHPKTGLIDQLEAMRYRSPSDQEKILWLPRNEPGDLIPGTPFSNHMSAMWLDQGKPWAYFMVEDMVYNVEVEEFIREKGYHL